MRRRSVLLSAAASALASVFTSRHLTAQEATPSGEDSPEGISVEPLAFGDVPAFPPLPATISLTRAQFAPGAAFEVPADDPGLALVYIEAGTATSRLNAATTILRGASMSTEVVAADTEVTLHAGDSFVGPPNSGGLFRNAGSETLVSLFASIDPAVSATPTP